MSEELQWFMGLNLVLAIWLGLLAEHWKGRGIYRWMVIGMVLSVAGLLLLAFLPSVKQSRKTVAGNGNFVGQAFWRLDI